MPAFKSDAFEVYDAADHTKRAALAVSGITTATKRTYTLPDVSGTIPTLGNAHTVTGAWVLGDASNYLDIVVDENGGFGGYGLRLNDATGGYYAVFGFASGLSSDITLNLPTTTTQLIGTAETASLSNKTLAASCVITCSASGVTFGSSTKGFRFDVTAIPSSTTRLLEMQNLLGTIPIVGNDAPAVASGALGKVDLTAQTADIATTNLSSTPPAGLYMVEAYLLCTTADAAAGTLTVTIGWTDTVGATTSTPITAFPLTATGRTTGRQLVQVASGDISYAVAVTGAYGTSAYAVYVRVLSLG